MSKWGTLSKWLKKSFLTKVKGMNDRGIMRTFHICALGFCLKLSFKGIVEMGYMSKLSTCTPFSSRFLIYKVGKTQFRGLCLSPLTGAL